MRLVRVITSVGVLAGCSKADGYVNAGLPALGPDGVVRTIPYFCQRTVAYLGNSTSASGGVGGLGAVSINGSVSRADIPISVPTDQLEAISFTSYEACLAFIRDPTRTPAQTAELLHEQYIKQRDRDDRIANQFGVSGNFPPQVPQPVAPAGNGQAAQTGNGQSKGAQTGAAAKP